MRSGPGVLVFYKHSYYSFLSSLMNACLLALLKASLHSIKINESIINKLMIYFPWNSYEWRTRFTAIQQAGEQVCGKGPGTWQAASWARDRCVSWQQMWPTASHPTHPTWCICCFFFQWLLKIKARHAKVLILITYSFNFLRKRNAGEMLENKCLCF